MTYALSTAVFVIFMIAAATFDLRTRRIPNVLTVSGFMIALALRSAVGGSAVLDGFQGAGIALLVVLPFFALGALGGGDLKLLVAVGAFMGPHQFLYALLATALLGVVLAVGESIRRGALGSLVVNTHSLGIHIVTGGRAGHRSTIASPGAVTVPYGLAIAIGSLAVWFLWPTVWAS